MLYKKIIRKKSAQITTVAKIGAIHDPILEKVRDYAVISAGIAARPLLAEFGQSKLAGQSDHHRGTQKDRGDEIHQKGDLAQLRKGADRDVNTENGVTKERKKIDESGIGSADVGDGNDRHR